MAFPEDPIGDQWTDGEDTNAEILHQRIDQPLDALRAAAALGWIAASNDISDVTLGGVQKATAARVTIVLEYSRRLRFDITARFKCNASAPGSYSVQAAYNSGSSPNIGSATLLPLPELASCSVVGAAGASSASTQASDVLDPGTYTIYGVVQVEAGGDSSDICSASHVIVTDLGGGS